MHIGNASPGSAKLEYHMVLSYLARHVVAAHLEHLQLVPNLLKIFGTPLLVTRHDPSTFPKIELPS